MQQPSTTENKEDSNKGKPKDNDRNSNNNNSNNNNYRTQYEEWVNGLFNELDLNKDGSLSPSEIEIALERRHISNATNDPLQGKNKENKLTPPKNLVTELMSDADKDGDGVINYQEFRAYMDKKEEILRNTFDQIDVNGDGSLDAEEIRKCMEDLYNVKISLSAARQMIAMVDTNVDGRISYDEWRDFMFLLPLHPLCCSTATSQNNKSHTHSSLMPFVHIFDHWTASACIDLGEGTVPISLPITQNFNDTYTSVWPILAAGATAGVVSRTATAPLDRIKTLMQVQTKLEGSSIRKVLQQIYKEGHLIGFWRGNGCNCVKIIPESATRFFAFDYYKLVIHNYNPSAKKGQITGSERFVAGALAGATAQTLIYPIDFVKTQLAASTTKVSVWEIVQRTWRINHFRGFYRGLTPSLLGILPYSGTDLAVYETLKTMYTNFVLYSTTSPSSKSMPKKREFASGNILIPLTCGLVSSSIAQLVSYPLNLARTRMAAQVPISSKVLITQGNLGLNTGGNVAISKPVYSGMLDVFQQTIKYEGIRGLYKGLGPNFLKVVPAVSISYTVYENSKAFFSNQSKT